MQIYPIKFNPIFHYRIWGGERLKTVLGKEYSEENIGESWEISTVEDNVSVVANGIYKGQSLNELIQTFGTDLLGKKVVEYYGLNFPLLIKFIDAAKPLSVQVHPNDIIAKERHNSFGKTEMWYVMDASRNAKNIIGFKEEVSKENYKKAIEQNRFESIMQEVDVENGDVFFLPAGRVHAIGADILLAEIQQTSNVTYRIYDYNRIDKDGKKRELHTEQAEDVNDYTYIKEPKTQYKSTENTFNSVVNCPYFHTQFLHLTKDFKLAQTDSFQILICTEGSAEISTESFTEHLKKGETILIPAAAKQTNILVTESTKLLVVNV